MTAQALASIGGRVHRLVVLVNDDEKAHIKARAQAVSMSVSDYLRTAGELFELPTEAEKQMLKELVQTLTEANAKSDATLARLEETAAAAAAFDEDAYREKVRAELLASEIDWQAVGARLGFVRDEAA